MLGMGEIVGNCRDFSKMTISAVQELVGGLEPSVELINLLKDDGRQGLAKLAQQLERQLAGKEELQAKYEAMLAFEREYWGKGARLVAGVDEAGRGPLAGPVVAAAVIIKPDFHLPGLNDSKQLSGEEREGYYDLIREAALAVGVGVVDHEEIDRINILQASFQAMRLALEELVQQGYHPEIVLVDGDKMIPDLDREQLAIIDGDAKCISIAAASVIAKVTRDRMMVELGKTYPGYGLERNKGYSAPEHLEGLRKLGPSPIHRKTFSLVRQATYSAVYQQLADQIFASSQLSELQEVGLVIMREKSNLLENEFAELLQIYSKIEKKLKNAAKDAEKIEERALKIL